VAEVRRLLADDLRFELPFERGNPVLDKTALVRLFTGLFESFSRFDLHIAELIECADSTQLVVRYDGDCLSRDGAVTYANKYLGLFRVARGQVVGWREYANPVLTRRMNEKLGAVDLG
jgi:ketosteroid isomerase-like protein